MNTAVGYKTRGELARLIWKLLSASDGRKGF